MVLHTTDTEKQGFHFHKLFLKPSLLQNRPLITILCVCVRARARECVRFELSGGRAQAAALTAALHRIPKQLWSPFGAIDHVDQTRGELTAPIHISSHTQDLATHRKIN